MDGSLNQIDREVYAQILTYFYEGKINNCSNKGLNFNIKGSIYWIPIYEINRASGGVYTILRALNYGWVYNNNYWKKNIKFKHIHSEILGTFEDEEYKFIDVKNKHVIDIGAYVGDTSIYFISRGANTVYAIEPHPGAYEELLENIKLNEFCHKITPLNMGIGANESYITINIDTKQAPKALFHNSKEDGVRVKVDTLTNIIEKYNIPTEVLKMDCEGCEYDIILKDYNSISNFEQIAFEYHAYNTGISVNKLLDVLKHGYTCEFVNEEIYRKNNPN